MTRRRPWGRARRSARSRAALVSLGFAALAACGTAPTAGGPVPGARPAPVTDAVPTGPLPVGPGSRAPYRVQAQPAPGTCHYRWVGADPLPDRSCTPGATDPDVVPADLGSTICRKGWTATVRPPPSVTGPEKARSAAAYGYTGPFATGEYDHLVPLELGGDPNDPANLWLEPNDRAGATSTANSKDVLENHLHSLVCAGRLPLGEAQVAIAADWVAARQRYGT